MNPEEEKTDQQDAGGTLPTGAPPPAAKLVTETDAREGDAAALVEAKRALQEAAERQRQVELRNMELEDKVRSLTTPPAPAPAPKRERAAGWLDAYRSPDELNGAD